MSPERRSGRGTVIVRECRRCRADACPDRIAAAGWHARQVKHNRKLERGCALQQELAPLVSQALQAHPLLSAAALPARIHRLLFSQQGKGESFDLLSRSYSNLLRMWGEQR